ncbi:MAG: CvpA family protein [Rhodospirillaceae bacterium]|nr:CvpA family protein [Rhodospirillaceae bacterium]
MDDLPISIVDLALIGVLILSALLAFVRGFVREVLSIGAWIGAIVATIYAFPYAQPYVREQIEIALLADAVTGLAIFIVALVILTVISHALSRNVRDSSLGAVDRSLGLLFGLVRGAVLICAAYLAMSWAIPKEEDRPAWILNARATPLVERGAEFLASLLPAEILQDGEDTAGGLRNDAEQLLEAGEAVETLTGTGSGESETGSNSDAAETPPDGYKDAERNDLDRLIESTE